MASASFEQKILIIDDEGHSFSLIGDLQEKRYGRESNDSLPSHLSMGWKVLQMSSFGTGKMAVLIEKVAGL